MDDRKKKQERGFLNRLAEERPDLFERHWVSREAPDFETNSSDGQLGLELARYFHPSGTKASSVRPQGYIENVGESSVGPEGYIEKVREYCVNVPIRECMPGSRISVNINPERWPRPFDCVALAEGLIRVVREKLPPPGQTTRVAPEMLPEIASHHGVLRIDIDATSDPSKPPYWTFPQFGYLRDFDLSTLKKVVDRHNLSFSKYRSQFKEVWLVVVGETAGLTTFGVKPDRQLLEKIESKFDRTFFFTLSSRLLIEKPH
jgi:hypothetical protein